MLSQRLILYFFTVCMFILQGQTGYADTDLTATTQNTHKALLKKPSKFIVITPPKCGTYLLITAINLLTKKTQLHYRDYFLKDIEAFFQTLDKESKNKRFLVSHLPPNKALIDGLLDREYTIITILRDPRDQLISTVHFILSGDDYDHLFDVPVDKFAQLSLTEQIDELMTGERFGFRLFDVLYRRHYKWLELDPAHLLVLRFEELVGPQGGGSRTIQIDNILKIAKTIGVYVSKSSAATMADEHLFGAGPHFRTGQSEQWKEVFTEEQKIRFDELYGEDLLYLGYPLYKE